jgi:hypothetical protein
MGAPTILPSISPEDARRLSRVFNAGADLRATEDARINEWLKGLIAFVGRCGLCHGARTVNFEQAHGWDEPCPRCSAPASEGGA